MRTVIVASPKANAAKRIQFEGTTFGELKRNSEFASLYGSGDGVEAVVNPGNLTLRGDDSVLPEGDLKVFIIATKNKAGWCESVEDVMEEVQEALEEVNQAQLNSLKDALIAVIKGNTVKSDDAELQKVLREAGNI
jgi:hypothetical protein